MAYSAVSVANSIIKLAKEVGIDDLSPMKLQKLMYFSQIFYFKNFETLLIDDNFVRWRYGPVIPSIYYELRNYGSNPINDYIRQLSPNFVATVYMIDDNDKLTWKFLNELINKLGKLSAIELSTLTHRENSSWSKNSINTVITLEDIDTSDL